MINKIFLLLIVSVAFAVLYCMYKPPNVELQQQADGVVLSNRFLGDYYLGFDRLVFKAENAGQIVCTFKPHSVLTLKLKAQVGSSTLQTVANKLGNKTPVTGTGQGCLLKPQKYHVEVWGNNGFGRITKSALVLDLSRHKQ